MSHSTDWKQTFPDNPNEEPSTFFLRLTMLTIASYCQGRRILSAACFKERVVEGKTLYIFKKDVEGGAKELWNGVAQLKNVFVTKTVSRVTFLICGHSVDNPIESLSLKFSFDPTSEESQVNSEEALEDLKENTFEQLKHIIAIARALPSIPASRFPLQFRLRYELNENSKDDAPSNPNFAYINVDPNVHQLYGNGANDLAFELKLGRGETMDIWYYSLLIQSTSEIDNAIDQFEKSDADVETDNSLDFE